MYRTDSKRGYRYSDNLSDSSSRTDIELVNGTIFRIVFPCYYAYNRVLEHDCPPRSIMYEDHIGWPEPRRADKSAQPPFPRRCWPPDLVVEPIDLLGEGYDHVDVVIPDSAEDMVSTIADMSDNVIRVTINAATPKASNCVIEVPYSVYVSGTFEHDGDVVNAKDVVTNGVIRILPAYYEE